jgi:addiction module HigA family antidote
MIPAFRAPTHPGEVLREEFLEPLGLDGAWLSSRAGLPPAVSAALLRGQLRVTPPTADRLAHALRTTPEFWLNLQQGCDAWHSGREAARVDAEDI